MPTFNCNEKGFLENLRRYMDRGMNPLIHRNARQTISRHQNAGSLMLRKLGLSGIKNRNSYKGLNYDIVLNGVFHKRGSSIPDELKWFPMIEVTYVFTIMENTYVLRFYVLFEVKKKVGKPKTFMVESGLIFKTKKPYVVRPIVIDLQVPREELLRIPIPRKLTLMDGELNTSN